MKKIIDREIVNIFFNYDPITGLLTHRFSRGGAKKGKEAGSLKESGVKGSVKLYRRVVIEGKFFYAHRVIWVIMTGEQPDEVDHVDGNGLNNKWNNLRNVSHRSNGGNQKTFRNNTSGVSGVSYRKDSGRWRSRIMFNDKAINLGTFSDKDDAISARKEAELKYFIQGKTQ